MVFFIHFVGNSMWYIFLQFMPFHLWKYLYHFCLNNCIPGFGTWFRHRSGHLHPMLECLGLSPSSVPESDALLAHTWEAAGDGSPTWGHHAHMAELVQSWLLWEFGSWTSKWKIFIHFFLPSFSLSSSSTFLVSFFLLPSLSLSKWFSVYDQIPLVFFIIIIF